MSGCQESAQQTKEGRYLGVPLLSSLHGLLYMVKAMVTSLAVLIIEGLVCVNLLVNLIHQVIGESSVGLLISFNECFAVDSVALAGSCQVAVRPEDLTAALEGLLHRIIRNGQVASTVGLRLAEDGDQIRLTAGWRLRDRWHIEPPLLIEPLRTLAAYGVTTVLEEDLESGEIQIVSWLPRAPLAPAVSY